jgi:hypothetical protein
MHSSGDLPSYLHLCKDFPPLAINAIPSSQQNIESLSNDTWSPNSLAHNLTLSAVRPQLPRCPSSHQTSNIHHTRTIIAHAASASFATSSKNTPRLLSETSIESLTKRNSSFISGNSMLQQQAPSIIAHVMSSMLSKTAKTIQLYFECPS